MICNFFNGLAKDEIPCWILYGLICVILLLFEVETHSLPCYTVNPQEHGPCVFCFPSTWYSHLNRQMFRQ